MAPASEPTDVAKTLSQYTPCDVSDALVEQGVKDGGYIPNLVRRLGPDKTIVGPAYTVLYASKSDPRPAISRLYIDEIPSGSVLVMALPLDLQTTSAPYVTVNNALYGGLMSTRAKYRGAHGSVILGRVRDLAEHRNLDYPVWSYGVGSTAPGPVVKVVGINVPVEVKVTGVSRDEILIISPGDYVAADENGVVRLPALDPEVVRKALEYIPKRVDADTKVADDISKGRPAQEAQKFWRSKI